MPGILGIMRPQPFEPDITATLDQMAEPLRYAPDQTVQHFQRGRFAGSVVDYGPRFGFLKPAAAERAGVLLLMDGEVFPDAGEVPRELQGDSPTVQRAEYCLHLYLERGPQFVRNLNGTFAIAVYDGRDHTVHLYNDRFGSAPLFVWTADRQFAFASSQRSLLCYRDDIGREYNRDAIAELVVFERVLGEKALFADIRRLVPASHAIWDGGRLKMEKYWHVLSPGDGAVVKDCLEAAVEFNRRLARSVSKRQADRATAAALVSGGIDSRLLLHFCSPETLVLTFSNRNHPVSIETHLAAKVAHTLRKKHFLVERESDHYAIVAERAVDVGESLRSFIGSHSLGLHDQMEDIGAQVVITGQFWDTLFKGMYSTETGSGTYHDEPAVLQARRISQQVADSLILRRTKHQALMALALSNEMRERAAVQKERVIQLMTSLVREGRSGSTCSEYFRLHDLQSTASIAFLRGLRTSFPDRSPIYDNDLLSFALSVPVELKAQGQIVRSALRIANRELARIPDANTGLPAGLCPPWSTFAGAVRDVVRRTARGLSSYSRTVSRLREAPAGLRIFARHSSWHDMNGMLRLCNRYRSMVEAAVERLDGTLFDRETVKGLLLDDLHAKAPRFNKLWEIVLTFQLFDDKWGPAARRPERPSSEHVVKL